MHARRTLLAFRLLFLLPFCFCLLSGCDVLRLMHLQPDRSPKAPPPPPAPKKTEFRVGQFIFLADFEVNRNLPLFRDLAQLRDQVYRELQLPPSSAPVYVHLFEDRRRYEQFMQGHYPNLPPRRAFFVAQPRLGGSEELLVYTYWGDRIQQDLRHELTHALLHGVLKDVPLWLDEGLAEYFEMPPGWQGVNPQHLAQLGHGAEQPFRPDLTRLEQLTEVQQMTPAEYREAWAWVHLMMHGKPEARKVLLGYLRELRTNPRPGPLGPRLTALCPALDAELHRHLARLDAVRPAAATAQR